MARAFGLVGHACATNESVKSVRRQAKRTHYVERVRECERVFEPHRTQRYGRISKRPCTLFTLLGAAALSCIHCSRRGLHGDEAAFTLCLLRFRARLLDLFLPRSHHNFCHFDIVTMRPLVPLQR